MWHFRRTTLQLCFCLAVLVGLALALSGLTARVGFVPFSLIVIALVWRRKTALTLLLVILAGVGIGLARGHIFVIKTEAYKLRDGQKITIFVTALNDGVYGANSQLSFDAGRVTIRNQPLAGKIKLSGFGPTAVYDGDEIVATGKLYAEGGQYQARMSYAQLQVIKHQASLVATFRRRFAAGLQTALPEPLASFALGLLIGQRSTLPDSVKQDLLMVGLTHIIAVSGYNLTIMLHASEHLLKKRSKRLSTGLSLSLIVIFLLITGSSASIVRAAIVSMLSIWAAYYGRVIRPLHLIALAASITAYANPFYIWGDVSWYLSFLAFYGVLLVRPALQSRWRSVSNSMLITVALESLCAELMTMPVVLFVFGQVSLAGLPANVAVAALVPLAMLLSLMAGLGGMLAVSLAGWIAWPARLLLTYMLDIAHLLAKVPHAFLQNIGLTIPELVASYVVLLLLSASLWFKQSKSAIITDKNY